MKPTNWRNNLKIIRQIHDTFKCEELIMEADIASQAVRLGTNTDFSLMSLFASLIDLIMF